MNKQKYEQEKYECWLDVANFCGFSTRDDIKHSAFDAAFDRAFELGKQFGNSEQLNAEGEEMLTCGKSKVQEVYKTSKEIVNNEQYGTCQYSIHTQIMCVLENLFGSKCLPDETKDETKESTPAEPKFKVGMDSRGLYRIETDAQDNKFKVRIPFGETEPYKEPEEVSKMKSIESKISVYIATEKEDEEFRLLLHNNGFEWHTGSSLIRTTFWSSRQEGTKMYYLYPDKTVTYYGVKNSDTLTLSEFKKRYFEEETSSNVNNSDISIDELVTRGYLPDPAKQFDTILKDGFSKERRLNIAAMAMQGILSNAERMKQYGEIAMRESDNLTQLVARNALRYADALITEAEKGGKNE